MEENCSFCDPVNIRKLKVLRGGCSSVIINYCPINKWHFLVIPDRHVRSITDLSNIERNDVFALVSNITFILKKIFLFEDFTTFFNEGKKGGQTKDHFHVHIVRRYDGDNFIPPGRENGEKIPISDEDIAEIKDAFSKIGKR